MNIKEAELLAYVKDRILDISSLDARERNARAEELILLSEWVVKQLKKSTYTRDN